MNIGDRISTSRRVNGLTVREFAQMAEVAPSTVTRVESGAIPPTGDLEEILLSVLGLSAEATSVADRDALAAARLALDPGCGIERTEGADVWLSRWERIGLVSADGVAVAGKRVDLAAMAATVSRLHRRTGLVDLPVMDWWDVADALEEGGVQWAATGSVAANLFVASAGIVRPTFYVDDVAKAVACLGAEPIGDGVYGPRVTLLPFDGVGERGCYVNPSGVPVAAFDQVVLDCLGGIGRMPEQAEAMLESVAGRTI